jgi:hypothetical protein
MERALHIGTPALARILPVRYMKVRAATVANRFFPGTGKNASATVGRPQRPEADNPIQKAVGYF